MATRNIEAIEHRGKVYVSLDDMADYLIDLADKANGTTGPTAVYHVLDQLKTIRERRAA